ncbi:MAG: hypothetical protein ACRDHE_08685 [Ktedonobacterales bacterium]
MRARVASKRINDTFIAPPSVSVLFVLFARDDERRSRRAQPDRFADRRGRRR